MKIPIFRGDPTDISATKKNAGDTAGQTVLVVTHGGVLSTLYANAHGHDRGAIVSNCSIGEVLIAGDVCAVRTWNDTSHLHGESSGGFGGGKFG